MSDVLLDADHDAYIFLRPIDHSQKVVPSRDGEIVWFPPSHPVIYPSCSFSPSIAFRCRWRLREKTGHSMWG